MNEYSRLSKAIESYEEHKPHHQYTVSWICDRIDWCWKWKRITETQMEELSSRISEVLKWQ